MRRAATGMVGLGIVVALAGCQSHCRLREESQARLDGAALATLAVETASGNVTIAGVADSDAIEIRVIKEATAPDDRQARECLAAIAAFAETEGDHCRIGWEWKLDKEPQWEASVSYEIRIPARLQTRVSTGNGSVTGQWLAAPIRVVCGNGMIQVREHRGDMDVQADNGTIKVQGVARQMRLIVQNGNITADLNGSQQVSGELRARNGSITLIPGAAASIAADCETTNGKVVVPRDLPTAMHGRHRCSVQLGAGEGKLLLRTTNGSVTIQGAPAPKTNGRKRSQRRVIDV